MTQQNTRLGIGLMLVTVLLFSFQDALSRHLAELYSVFVVVTLRFWFSASFAVTQAARHPGGIRAVARTRHPVLQILRGALLVGEICIIVASFVKLGLVATHAIFVTSPLMVTALSGPVLGEKVGWRRWTAIGVGLVGVLIVIRPGAEVLNPWVVLPFASAFCFALYGLLTRYVSREDPAQTSFFWMNIAAAATITPVGLWHWQWLAGLDWLWMGALCLNATLAHFLFIRANEVAEASAIQPFVYFQLPTVAILGVIFFGETLRWNVVAGAAIVVAAGLFTLWREQQLARRQAADRAIQRPISDPA